MKTKSWPSSSNSAKKFRAWRSCSSFSRLDQEKHWSPKFLRNRRRGPEACSSDSDPVPGPSGVSHVSQRPPDSERHSSKRKREEGDEIKEDSPSKKSRSKSPTPGETKSSRRLAEARRRRKQHPDSRPSSEEKEATEAEWRLHRLNCTPTDSNENDEDEDEEEKPTYPLNREAHAAFRSKYLMVRPLFYGGFGKICSGIRLDDNLSVVIKYISKHRVPFTEMEVNGTLTRLPVEVFLLMRVGAGPDDSSSSVAPRLLDWYDLGPEVALVIERPEPCMDLSDYITEKNPDGVSVSEARIMFRQLVEAAIEMEAKGVFHQDIKPENILVETGADVPRARFIDFGCGSTCTPGQTFDKPHGTPQYMTPEWFRSSSYTSTSATAWQLGLVLFAMLFNKKPLVTERTIGSMQGVPIPKSVSEECRDLLRGCLAKNPKKRLSLEQMRDHPWLNSD